MGLSVGRAWTCLCASMPHRCKAGGTGGDRAANGCLIGHFDLSRGTEFNLSCFMCCSEMVCKAAHNPLRRKRFR